MPTILTIPRDTFIPQPQDAWEFCAKHGMPVGDALRLQAFGEFVKGNEVMCWHCLLQAEFYGVSTP